MTKGMRKDKPHTLILRFTSKEALIDFIYAASGGKCCVYEADALDPEMEGTGRAPANTYVVREHGYDGKPEHMKVKA